MDVMEAVSIHLIVITTPELPLSKQVEGEFQVNSYGRDVLDAAFKISAALQGQRFDHAVKALPRRAESRLSRTGLCQAGPNQSCTSRP